MQRSASSQRSWENRFSRWDYAVAGLLLQEFLQVQKEGGLAELQMLRTEASAVKAAMLIKVAVHGGVSWLVTLNR